jgi:hypothetical protein
VDYVSFSQIFGNIIDELSTFRYIKQVNIKTRL